MESPSKLPWWLVSLFAGACVAIVAGVIHSLPPEWGWPVAVGVLTVVLTLLWLNPRYRYLRLSVIALNGWLGARGLASLTLLLWPADRPWIVAWSGDPPWGFDAAAAVIVLGLAFLDHLNNGGMPLRFNKTGPVQGNSGNTANLSAGDDSQQTVNQVAGDQITNHFHGDPGKATGNEAEMLNLVQVMTQFTGDGSKGANRSSSVLSSASPDLQSRVANELTAAIQLGIDQKSFFSAMISGEPPPMPEPHLSRASTFSVIARLFDTNRVAGIIGYSESGKSTTVAEYTMHCDGDVFWFAAFDDGSSDSDWLTIFSLSLSTKLGEPSLRVENLARLLSGHDRQLLIVLDDAHRFHELGSLDPLVVAVRSNSKISLLFVGVDTPDFVSSMRSRGIEACRVPGLSAEECSDLFGILPGEQTIHTIALESLRVRCGGHIGLLRLGWPDIQSLKTAEQCIEYMSRLPEVGNIGLESMQAALVERLRSGLSDDETLLCRRLSLVTTKFNQSVGLAVWVIDKAYPEFSVVWGNCARKVFESGSSKRYSIPEIYEAGFRKELSPDEQATLHGVIADALQNHGNEPVDFLDVHAVVFHRLLSGDVDGAMHSAAMYVTYAQGPGARQAQNYLLQRFDALLSSVDERVYSSGVVQWHATRARTYDELDNKEQSEAATRKLHEILLATESQGGNGASPESRQLGWLVVLIYAAKYADPDLALQAVAKTDGSNSHSVPKMPVQWDVFLVLSACLPSEKPILPYLARVLEAAAEGSFAGWYETESIHAYEFWRVVASRLYRDFRHRSGDEQGREADNAAIQSIVDVLWEKGVNDVAAIIECSLVRVEIDFFRDFAAAEIRSQQLADRAARMCDPEVQVHVLQTRADALRCSDRDADAIEVYRSALEMQPQSDWSEEADLHLLLAISEAKNGRWEDATRSAARSAGLFCDREEGDVSDNQLAAAKSWLEAAGFAIHGGSYFRAARFLLRAYTALESDHQDDPLWAALAQISWSLVNRVKPESSDPQPPIPGFTLNLQDTEESRKMERSATVLMLGRVCTVVGRPFRAIRLFDAAIQASPDDDNKPAAAFFGIEAAIEAEDVVAASRFATLASIWMCSRPDGKTPQGHAYVYDFLMGRTFRLISKQIGTDGADERLGDAIDQVRLASKDGTAESLFLLCLESLKQAISSGEWADLEEVFHACEEHQASWLSKEIAWIACYRCEPTKITEAEFINWHWRVVRWSIVVGDNDPAFLQSAFEQQRDYWKRITADSRSLRVQAIIDVLESAAPDRSGLISVAQVAGGAAASILSLDATVRELHFQLPMPGGVTIAKLALEELSLRFLDRCLDPFATRHAASLAAQLQSIVDILIRVDPHGQHAAEFSRLLAFAKSLDVGEPNQAAYDAVRRVVDVAEQITADSAAQGFVYLRHWLQFAPADFDYAAIAEVLAKPRVRKLIDDGELSDFMQIRLRVAHGASVAFLSQRRLSMILARIGTQIQARSPIREDAILQAALERDAELQTLQSVVKDLEVAATEARSSKFAMEEWNALFELGGLLQMLGVTLLRFARDERAGNKYLREAIRAFRGAAEAIIEARDEQTAEMLAKAAFSGRSLAQELEDGESLAFFEKVIERIRSAGDFDSAIQRQEEAETNSIVHLLHKTGNDEVDELAAEDFEEYVERIVDHLMESTGWPEDRRPFVEDDIRKLQIFETEKSTFCKHLLPLQDLRHTQHPATVYAEPTNYTVGCALLGTSTSIGVEDIDVALNAMKSTHCDECPHREAAKKADDPE